MNVKTCICCKAVIVASLHEISLENSSVLKRMVPSNLTTKAELVHYINLIHNVKGMDQPFKLRGKSRLIRSVITNWRLGNFFLSHFKWPSSQDQQKTNSCRLIIFKVTLTGQSHFMLYSTVQYSRPTP